MTIKIGEKNYTLRMTMYACRVYKKATGKDLLSNDCLNQIFGDGKERTFDADLYISFLHACIQDGLYPEKCELTIDDLAVGLSASDFNNVANAIRFYVGQKNGLTDEQVEELFKKKPEPPAALNP